jgi:hypothetical protein
LVELANYHGQKTGSIFLVSQIFKEKSSGWKFEFMTMVLDKILALYGCKQEHNWYLVLLNQNRNGFKRFLILRNRI